MIKSRTTTPDPKKSCSKCVHLAYDKYCYYCKIDGAYVPDPEAITMVTCRKFIEVKEVKDHGSV